MRFFYKPTVPTGLHIAALAIHALELFAIYFGFQLMTGQPGVYGVGLDLFLLCLFELTWVPAIMLPFTLMGTFYLTGLPWIMTLPFFALPYLYNLYYMRRYRSRVTWMRLERKYAMFDTPPSRFEQVDFI